jgi:hypothetical protein
MTEQELDGLALTLKMLLDDIDLPDFTKALARAVDDEFDLHGVAAHIHEINGDRAVYLATTDLIYGRGLGLARPSDRQALNDMVLGSNVSERVQELINEELSNLAAEARARGLLVPLFVEDPNDPTCDDNR